jgi:hypothetical protein
MSYTLVIVPAPVPKDDAAAWQVMSDLAERPTDGEVPAVFQALIDRLTARYPCICDLPDDQVDDGVWSDGPLRNNAGPAVTVLGLASTRVMEVRPFVIDTASRLGLIVFDEQEGRIYRPGSAEGGKRPWWKFWG